MSLLKNAIFFVYHKIYVSFHLDVSLNGLNSLAFRLIRVVFFVSLSPLNNISNQHYSQFSAISCAQFPIKIRTWLNVTRFVFLWWLQRFSIGNRRLLHVRYGPIKLRLCTWFELLCFVDFTLWLRSLPLTVHNPEGIVTGMDQIRDILWSPFELTDGRELHFNYTLAEVIQFNGLSHISSFWAENFKWSPTKCTKLMKVFLLKSILAPEYLAHRKFLSILRSILRTQQLADTFHKYQSQRNRLAEAIQCKYSIWRSQCKYGENML